MALNLVFCGTYTAPGKQVGRDLAPGELVMGMADPTGSEGIYVFRLDATSGALSPLQTIAAVNPTFLALDQSERFLFCVNEVRAFGGEQSGAVTSYAINADTGDLRLID